MSIKELFAGAQPGYHFDATVPAAANGLVLAYNETTAQVALQGTWTSQLTGAINFRQGRTGAAAGHFIRVPWEAWVSSVVNTGGTLHRLVHLKFMRHAAAAGMAASDSTLLAVADTVDPVTFPAALPAALHPQVTDSIIGAASLHHAIAGPLEEDIPYVVHLNSTGILTLQPRAPVGVPDAATASSAAATTILNGMEFTYRAAP